MNDAQSLEPVGRLGARLDELLVKTSRTFALSIPVLPEPTRREVTVAYLLFRVADTLEDATLWARARKLSELESLRGLLAEPRHDAASRLAARWSAEPPLRHDGYQELLGDLATVIDAYRDLAPAARAEVGRHLVRTVELMASFVAREDDGGLELGTLDDLRRYCYAVAGIVGEMLTELFVLGRGNLQAAAPFLRDHAATFGEALQLVNILKDAAFDAREGRRYLPSADERPRVFALARDDLGAAGRYVHRLHESGAPRGIVEFTALPVLLAWATLDRVETDGPGSKLSREEVQAIVHRLGMALDVGTSDALGDAGLARKARPPRRRARGEV